MAGRKDTPHEPEAEENKVEVRVQVFVVRWRERFIPSWGESNWTTFEDDILCSLHRIVVDYVGWWFQTCLEFHPDL